MRVGAVFPQIEIGTDPGAVRDWAQAAEGLGYHHIAIFDHVLGASRIGRPNWGAMYDHTDQFHEPFVLMGFLSAATRSIEMATSILVLPQRQAALAAKQAAAVDILSGGRLRLGVGAGWNEVEFEALGASFKRRGESIEEQIEVMRALWTSEVIDFEGDHHRIAAAGINPPPVQRPIPVWMGGGADQVLRRIGRLADGWFANTSRRTASRVGIPPFAPDERGRERLSVLAASARAAGRDPAGLGVEVRIELSGRDADSAAAELERWRDFGGVTHAQFGTMRAGLKDPGGHMLALERFREAAGPF